VAGLTLDASALIAYERGQERIRKILTVGYERGLVPTIPAIALAEVWHGDAKDARVVARLLKACSIEVVDEQLARAAGSLRRATPGADTIDACIAVGVRRRGDTIATSDPDDMRAPLGNGFTILAV
jgi:predicted nucleic acid-binding protein